MHSSTLAALNYRCELGSNTAVNKDTAMSILMIVAGLMIARFGAGLFVVGEAQGGQSPIGGLLTLIIQLSGWGLVIWGAIRLFS